MTVNPLFPALVAAGALLVGVAHADTLDDQFLGSLSNDGLSVAPPDQLIAIAHERCDDERLPRGDSYSLYFGGHPSPWRVAMSKIGVKLEGMGLTEQQVRPFMQDAINVYCPGATNFG
jgi:uncharacterized protein DUF732